MGHFLHNIINLFRRQRPTYFVSPISRIDYSKSYNVDGNFKDDFYQNLTKTIVWTEKIVQAIKDTSKINYSRVLRTTNPPYEGKPFYRFDDTLYNYPSTPDIGFNYDGVLTEALSFRKDKALPKKSLNEVGKILKFEIDITTHDGAPCAESGFVDESDIPPIDTWFYITQKYLYCWIPTMFIDKMQEAIDVEIFGSYSWLEEIDPYLNIQIIKQLRSSG
jgi:hypothetical protein